MNTEESSNDICDHCNSPLDACDCESIQCQKCEDGMPRKHSCTEDGAFCEYCDEPIDDCNCQPSDHY